MSHQLLGDDRHANDIGYCGKDENAQKPQSDEPPNIWETSSTKEVKTDGQFVRKASAFRNWVTEDGTPGPTGEGGYAAEAGRYHLYVSYACPWAHRALIYRNILGLEDAIDISVVHPVNMENGWDFEVFPGATPDKIGNARYMHEVYTRAAPDYSGKVTVPVLWDRKTGSIVNNESADIIRIIGSAFRPFAKSWQEFLPDELIGEIDEINDLVYRAINNGVYRTGFAETQEAYEAGIDAMFDAFATLDARLAKTRFLHGDRIVESDLRLFTTMIRFEPVYYFHFKCNLKPLASYPNLRRHTRDILNYPGVRSTVNLDHINTHYYMAHRRVNPLGLIPVGANVDLDGPDWHAPTDEELPPC